MLTQKEIVKEALTLPIGDQRKIVRILQAELEGKSFAGTGTAWKPELSVEEKVALTQSLAGSLHPEGKYIPMTKAEDREMIEEYLEEKHS